MSAFGAKRTLGLTWVEWPLLTQNGHSGWSPYQH